MIEQLISYIQLYVIPLGALGIFFAAFLEEIIVWIPSALVMTAAGFFFLPENFDLHFLSVMFFTIVIPISLGVTIGSIFVYAIGYYGGKPAILKWGKWFGISWEDIELLDSRVRKNNVDEIALFLLRAIPILPSSSLAFFSGMIRLNLKRYLIGTSFGIAVRTVILALLGWSVGEVYHIYAGFFDNVELFGFIALVVFIGSLYAYKKFISHKLKRARSDDSINNHE